MTMKPFEIQSAGLILGGVKLEAGATGVVIPGITRAASYQVEEVGDTEDQTHVFAANDEVVIIDYALYTAIVEQGDEGHFADFTATTDDEGYIDYIEVNGQGTYNGAESSAASNQDMYAYIGTASASDRPLVTEDWIQIPFRPKMKAGEVENIGGGGSSSSTGDITFDGVNIIGTSTGDYPGLIKVTPNDNNTYTEAGQFLEIYPTRGQDAPHIHIAAGAGGDLMLGDDMSYVDVNHDGSVKVQTYNGENTPTQWQFKTNGDLQLPPGGDIVDSNGASVLGGTSGGSTLLPAYKGFRAHYGSMYDNNNDPNGPINKIVIYKDTVTPSSTIDDSTNNDTFTVTGLTGSDVVAMLVVVSDNITQTSVTDLKTFAEAIIENVVLNNGVEGDTRSAADMKTAFYDNFNNFNTIIGSVKTNLEFFSSPNTPQYNITNVTYNGTTGAGANFYGLQYSFGNSRFELGSWGQNQPGGYVVGDTFTILGTDITDANTGTPFASPANDTTITITVVDGSGFINEASVTTGLPVPSIPDPIWPSNYIGDGGNDEYDDGNYINTDLQNEISYNNGDVVTSSSAFGGGDYVVTYKDGIFGIFATNSSINTLGTDGGSGFDGDGVGVTGGLYGESTPAVTAVVGIERHSLNQGDNNITLAVEHNGKFLYYNGSNGNSWIYLPSNNDAALPIGFTVTVVMDYFDGNRIYVNNNTGSQNATVNASGFQDGTTNAWVFGATANKCGVYTIMKVETDRWMLAGPDITQD